MNRTLRSIVLPALGLALAALAAGLARNALLKPPLPLFSLSPAQRPPSDPDLAAIEARVPELEADMVRQLSQDPGTVLVDARTGAEYAAGHLPGALSLPVGDFAAAWPPLRDRLQEAASVIVYCRNRECHDSLLLTGRLLEAGLTRLLLFRGGIEEWTRRGYDAEN